LFKPFIFSNTQKAKASAKNSKHFSFSFLVFVQADSKEAVNYHQATSNAKL
jgi:hypothetical protein